MGTATKLLVILILVYVMRQTAAGENGFHRVIFKLDIKSMAYRSRKLANALDEQAALLRLNQAEIKAIERKSRNKVSQFLSAFLYCFM